MTMFAFFFINGVVDLLVHYRVQGMPKGLDYFSGALAFAIEGKNGKGCVISPLFLPLFFPGILFYWHLSGRPPMDVQLHTFLIYIGQLERHTC